MSLKQVKVELCSVWGGDRASALAAWASSYDQEIAEAKSDADVARIVTGMVTQHHDTPKERTWVELFFTVPIFVERQFDKYRMTVQFQQFAIEYYLGKMGRDAITQNELSGRYRTIPDRPYGLPKDVADILARVEGQKPYGSFASYTEYEYHYMLEQQHGWYKDVLDEMRDAEKAGKITNTEYKRAREVLRGVLGTSFLTDMRIVMNMNAFEHIVNQRIAREAQLESRVAALGMIHAVQDSGKLPVLITEMIAANGWAEKMREAQEALDNDE